MERLTISKYPRVRAKEPTTLQLLIFLYKCSTLSVFTCARIAHALRDNSNIVIFEYLENKVTKTEKEWLEKLYYEGSKYFKIYREQSILPFLQECKRMKQIKTDSISIKIITI